MPILLKPTAQIDLNHRAYLFGGFSKASGYAVASEQGHVTIISPDLNRQSGLKRSEKLQSISIHPTQPLLAIVEGGDSRLNFVDIDGLSTSGNQSVGTDEGWTWNNNPSAACLFSSDGRYLWYGIARSEDEIEVRLLECVTWHILSSVVINDPYTQSRMYFHVTGADDKVALWLAAGQDGQQVYWLTPNGVEITCEIEPKLEDTTPPTFSPSGEGLVVICGQNALLKCQFPKVELLAEYQWPDAEEQEEAFSDSLCYVGEDWALAISLSERLFLFDLTQMTVSDEVWIEGHEPKPTLIYYPILTDDGDVCTDIVGFKCVGNMIALVFRRDAGSGHVGWKDSLLFVSIPALIAQLEGAD